MKTNRIAIEVPYGADYSWYLSTCKKYHFKPSPFYKKDYIQHAHYICEVLYKLEWEKNQAVTNVQRQTNKVVNYATVRCKSDIKADKWVRYNSIGEL